MSVTRELLLQRHNYYRWLLVVEVLAMIGLRPLQQAPQLVCLVYLTIAGVGVLMDSPLLPHNRLTPHLKRSVLAPKDHQRLQRAMRRRGWLKNGWLIAAAVELLWQASLLVAPMVAVQLSVVHVLVWTGLMLYVLWALTTALAEELVFNGAMLMGAAAGYLLIGFTGGIVLNSLLVLDPQAFNLSSNVSSDWPLAIAHAPQMRGAAFGSLTTLGSSVFSDNSLTSVSASVAITIVGQFYVAILIAGVLGKPRQIAAVRKAAHPRRRSQAPSPRLRRIRR